jgi:uncharacterized damage-inducible protein DinB
MLKLFQYNWQVRDDWFIWCEDISDEGLIKKRVGGVGSILYTLFHIVDVEYSWICGLQGKPEPEEPPFEDYASLQRVKDFSRNCHGEVEAFVKSWTDEMENQILTELDFDEKTVGFKYGEVMRHVIAHEIHHIGQLSIWSRELGEKPVTANLIRRGLFDN